MSPETEELVETIERLMQIEARPFATPSVGQQAVPRPAGIGNTINALCEAIQDRLAPDRRRNVNLPPDRFFEKSSWSGW